MVNEKSHVDTNAHSRPKYNATTIFLRSSQTEESVSHEEVEVQEESQTNMKQHNYITLFLFKRTNLLKYNISIILTHDRR